MESEIVVNGITYVKKEDKTEGLPYVIVRSQDAGIFAGYLVSRDGTEVELTSSRKLYYWSGAATLSQVAMEGVKNPSGCKFTMPTDKDIILGVSEVIYATEDARKNIEGVWIWKK